LVAALQASEAAAAVTQAADETDLNEGLAKAIACLWRDPTTRAAFAARGRELQITDSVETCVTARGRWLCQSRGLISFLPSRLPRLCHRLSSRFFDKVEEIARPEYVPSVEDVLLARQRTSGIIGEHPLRRRERRCA
jgi:hypothetical protein